MDIKKLIATGAIAGFVVVGGMQLAGAQEATDDSTTTTVEDREGCDKDGDGAPDADADTDTDTTVTEPSPEA